MTDKQKRPFNPYYVCVWYGAYLFIVSIAVLSLSSETIHSIYIFLQNIGAEGFLLSSRRLNSMHSYLVEQGNAVRWEHLTCYFSFLVAGFLVALPIALIPTNRYLAWYSTTNETWSKPLIPAAKKFGWRTVVFAVSYIVIMFWGQIYYIGNWQRHGRGVDNIHFSDGGYFHMAVSTALIIGAIQYVHFVAYRFWKNYQMVTKPDKGD